MPEILLSALARRDRLPHGSLTAGAVVILLLVVLATFRPLFVPFSLLVIIAVLVGVVMKEWTVPLGPDEVAVIHGRVVGEDKVVLSGRVLKYPGSMVEKLSTRRRLIDFAVDCQSVDEVPLELSLTAGFGIPRDEASVLAVSRGFRGNEEAIARQVRACLTAQIRDVVGGCEATLVNHETGRVTSEASRRAAAILAGMGFELLSLTAVKVAFPPAWKAALEKRQALTAEAKAIEVQLGIEDNASQRRAQRSAYERTQAARTEADNNAYAQRKQLEISREHMLLAAEKQNLDRLHTQRMAEQEAIAAREMHQVKREFHVEIVKLRMLELAPKIIAADRSMFANLRTLIAGSSGNGLEELLTRLTGMTAALGPEMSTELNTLLSSLTANITPGLTADGTPPAPLMPPAGAEPGHTALDPDDIENAEVEGDAPTNIRSAEAAADHSPPEEWLPSQ